MELKSYKVPVIYEAATGNIIEVGERKRITNKTYLKYNKIKKDFHFHSLVDDTGTLYKSPQNAFIIWDNRNPYVKYLDCESGEVYEGDVDDLVIEESTGLFIHKSKIKLNQTLYEVKKYKEVSE